MHIGTSLLTFYVFYRIDIHFIYLVYLDGSRILSFTFIIDAGKTRTHAKRINRHRQTLHSFDFDDARTRIGASLCVHVAPLPNVI